MREAIAGDRNGMKNVVAERLGNAELAATQPVMVERDDAERASNKAERVHVRFVGAAPAVEGNAELVGPARGGEEFRLVDGKRIVELLDRRDRRFADSDDADLIGFDERDRHAGDAEPPERGRGHPSRRAAPDDDDPALIELTHVDLSWRGNPAAPKRRRDRSRSEAPLWRRRWRRRRRRRCRARRGRQDHRSVRAGLRRRRSRRWRWRRCWRRRWRWRSGTSTELVRSAQHPAAAILLVIDDLKILARVSRH